MKSIAYILFACVASLATASPTRQRSPTQPEARAIPAGSAGVMCYFSCPDITGTTFKQKSGTTQYTGSDGVVCTYNDNASCYYRRDGFKSVQDPNDGRCPNNAPTAGCGQTNPDPQRAFRRAHVPRARTKAEQRIQSRQYKPGKVRKATSNKKKARKVRRA